MKRFLLTWYGITDLRAALGFEEQGGPVLGALMTREYSHVLILAYTEPNKTRAAVPREQENDAPQQAGVPAAPVAGRLSREEQTAAVDAFSNTPEGHALFGHWLRAEIAKRDLLVAIRVVPRELASLNDSKGIYDAAAEALDVVLAIEGEKTLTLYLSPGTPVMAFTWALVSLMNPEIHLRILVAPDPRHPPVEVPLPYELLDPGSRKRRRIDPVGDGGFDIVFHLFGEQRIPTLMAMLQFPAKRHVFVTSPKYPAACMLRFLPEGASSGELHVDPFDPRSTHREILGAVVSLPAGSRVGLNLTGGTKLMFAGAQAVARKIGGVPFYFESRDQSLIFLDDFSTMEVRGVNDVEQFVELSGFSVSRRGLWADHPVRERRRALTTALWRERRRIAQVYSELADVNDRPPRPFRIERRTVEASLDDQMRGRLRLGNSEHVVEQCPDFAGYLCGGWLEEYVFMLLQPLVLAGKLRDLRIGLEVSWKTRVGQVAQDAAQEFDVALTDGRRLFILECKAGRVTNEDVYKLENVVRNYGGVEARGMLLSAFEPVTAPRRRLDAAKNLTWMSGDDVPAHLETELVRALGERRGAAG